MKTTSFISKLVVIAMVAFASVAHAADEEKKEEKSVSHNQEVTNVVKRGASVSSMTQDAMASNQLAIFFASDVITVSFINNGLEPAVFTVYDLDGQTIYRKTTRNNPLVHHRVATQNLPEGKYFASLKVGKEKYSKEFEIAR